MCWLLVPLIPLFMIFSRIGLLEILQGQRPETPAYLRFQVSMKTIVFCRSNPTMQEWHDRFDDLIREKHSWQSFQHPDKIAEASKIDIRGQIMGGCSRSIR